MFSERRSFHIPNHVVLGEIFKAVDCRLTELLFLCGVYPEKDWVDQKRSLSFSKKIRIAGKLFPQDIVFHTLNRKMADQRNYAEHRFEEPKDQAVQEALETMNAFIKMTAGLFCILEEFSMFKFQVDEQSEAVVIQIMREQGTLLLLEDGEDPANLFGMPAQSELGQGIIKKVLGDIEWYLQYDPKFMTRLGFL